MLATFSKQRRILSKLQEGGDALLRSAGAGYISLEALND